MEKITSWVKAHPYATGILVVGGGLVFILFSGWFSGGNSTVVSGGQGPSEASVAAATQLQLAGISAGVANNRTNAELGVASMASDVAKLQAQLDAQLGLAAIDASRSVSLADIGAGQASYNTGAAVQLAGIAATTDIEKAKLEASTSLTQQIIDALKPQAPVVNTVVSNQPAYTPTPQFDDYVRINPDLWQHTVRVAESVGADPYNESFQAQVGQQHWAEYGQYEQGQGRFVPTV